MKSVKCRADVMTAFTVNSTSMTRVDIATGMPFDNSSPRSRRRHRRSITRRCERIAAAGGDWDDVRAAVAKNAPNELMVYAKIDATALFSVAGHRTQAIEYLIGNHVIAETMFRHDPKALLYAPLRMLVYSDARRQRDLHDGPARPGIRQSRHRRGDRSR